MQISGVQKTLLLTLICVNWKVQKGTPHLCALTCVDWGYILGLWLTDRLRKQRTWLQATICVYCGMDSTKTPLTQISKNVKMKYFRLEIFHVKNKCYTIFFYQNLCIYKKRGLQYTFVQFLGSALILGSRHRTIYFLILQLAWCWSWRLGLCRGLSLCLGSCLMLTLGIPLRFRTTVSLSIQG